MILDQITLHDFGVYAGVQKIGLTPPSLDKPIVLFGGMNGTGKTTLMDALQLCLFGPATRCARRNGSDYKNFLDSKICKRSPRKQASVSVDFRYTADSEETCYRVTRTWQNTGSSVRERLEVTRDQRTDKSLTENWGQFVNEFIPVNLAHLFFFDGENIAAYATPDGTRQLIANGVRNLFGIDVVERLQKDLQILERRRQNTTIPAIDNEVIRQKEKELQSLHKQIEQMVEERSVLQTRELDRVRDDLTCVMEEYRMLGGEFRDRREQIQCRINKAESNLDACKIQMAELAASELPLLLIQDLLHEVAHHAEKEQKIVQARVLVENLNEHDTRMLRLVQTLPDTSAVVAALEEFCRINIEELEEVAAGKTLLNLSDASVGQLNSFLQSKPPHLEKSVRDILAKQRNLENELKAAQLEEAGIPSEDCVDEIVKKRDLLVTKISQLENTIASIDSELKGIHWKANRLESEIKTLWDKNAKLELSHRDIARFVQHSQLARQTLKEFGSDVMRRQIGRVEHSVLESFQSLLRKDRLISALKIHPESFDVLLHDTEQSPISHEQLSASERQLLAIALLWGMARTSGKLLPVAIDSPMGRLDSTHRDRLIEQYFPSASHQTLLFTTDEEIAGDYLHRLRPWVGKSYHLDYDDETSTTTVSNGLQDGVWLA